MIIIKCVSKFARNLLDCIDWVRELKDKHDPTIDYEKDYVGLAGTGSFDCFLRWLC